MQPTGGGERIHPVVPDRDLRALLGLSTRQAVFSLERLTRAGNEPVEFRHTFIRGDRYRFVVEWSNSSGYTVSLSTRRHLRPDAG